MDSVTKVFIGVDVSKEKLDVHIYPLKKNLTIKNSEQDIKGFISILSEYSIGQIGCESTGGYEAKFRKILKENGYSVWNIDPRRIKAFKIASGRRAKTDKIDAQKIAEFLSNNPNSNQQIDRPKDHEELQSLVNRKNVLVKIRATERTRLKQPSHELSTESIKKHINYLDGEIELLKKAIQKIIDNDSDLAKKSNILKSIPGIGPTAASTLLSFVPELGELSNKKITALLGLCPYDNQSGKYCGKKFIQGGRSIPRKILYMCGLSAIVHNSKLKGFYERLIKSGKCYKVAMVAVMHKLLVIANALLTKNETFKVNV